MEEHDKRAADAQTAKDTKVAEDKVNEEAAEQQRVADEEAATEAKRVADEEQKAAIDNIVKGSILAAIQQGDNYEQGADAIFAAIKDGTIPNVTINY